MVSLSPVSTPVINNSTREQPSVRGDDNSGARERLATTKPFNSALAQSENSTQKNYQQQQFASAKLPDASNAQGNRRGSLLDLSV